MDQMTTHRQVLSQDGTTSWCSTCEDPRTGQTFELWPCRVQRLADVLRQAGVRDLPPEVLERAAAVVTRDFEEVVASEAARLEREHYPGEGTAADQALRAAPGVSAARRHAARDLRLLSDRQAAEVGRDLELAAVDVLNARGGGARWSLLVRRLSELTDMDASDIARALADALRRPDAQVLLVPRPDGRVARLRTQV